MPNLHLWRLALDPARLAAIAREQRIPVSDEDHGYAGHALLCGLFGKERTPKPWHLDERRMVLWAYAPLALDDAERTHADPLFHVAVRWEHSASRPMPLLKTGQRVGFDLRACPVVRHGGRDQQTGSEHDYLLWREVRRRPDDPANLDPLGIYAEWLAERGWKAASGAVLTAAQVTGWSKPMGGNVNAWRGRGDGRLRLPDVRFTGVVTVSDPAALQTSLARGIGRHRAFGFGMLLLKPAAG